MNIGDTFLYKDVETIYEIIEFVDDVGPPVKVEWRDDEGHTGVGQTTEQWLRDNCKPVSKCRASYLNHKDKLTI